jgi:hypothetical protein
LIIVSQELAEGFIGNRYYIEWKLERLPPKQRRQDSRDDGKKNP